MQIVEADGVRLAYTETGSGPDTVLVHGIPTDYRAWDAQIGPLSQNSRVMAYSRRCAKPNNNKVNPTDSTIESNARDLGALIEKTTTRPVNVIGHSYGGFISAYLAATRPTLVKRLILIEPGITTLLVRDPDSRSQALSLLLRSPSIALAARRYIKQYYNPLLAAYRKGDLDTALQYFLDGLMNKSGALAQLPVKIQTMLKENAGTIGEVEAKLPPFTKKDAQKISAPTLLINGANGTRIFQAINHQLAQSIPQSETAMIPESSHFPHFENAPKFNEKVLEFLGRN
jgi:pimeloyl-ACP methyl ester carboxylesterase